jgi:metal-sulfur cluster biosynthetic enzyme
MATEETAAKPAKASSPIVAEAEKQEKILNALQAVLDPEIGLSVIDLDLIREVVFTPDEAEVKMVLTTPFCPWAGELIQTIKTKTEEVVGPPVKVTLLADRWEPPPGLF